MPGDRRAQPASGPRQSVVGSLHRLAALVRHSVVLLRRDPGPVVSRLCMPVVLLVVFQPLYRAALASRSGTSAIAETAPRLLVMVSMFGVSMVGVSMLSERLLRTWSRLSATPVKVWELLVGKTLPLFGVLLAQQVLVLSLARLAFGLRLGGDLPVLLAAGVSWALCVLALGALMSSFVHSQSQLSSFSDVGGLVLSSLGGAMAPVTMMPGWVAAIAPASPAYWGVRALRGGLQGQPGQAASSIAVLCALTVTVGAIACWRIGRSWGQPTLIS